MQSADPSGEACRVGLQNAATSGIASASSGMISLNHLRCVVAPFVEETT
jgi:hypothetical protein